MSTIAFQIIAGLVLLIVGAELLVRYAAELARGLGLSPMVIGLTVVAFGTSTPELAISVKAALSGQPELALGNVVGSNIANILLIIGLSALLVPLVVKAELVRFDVPIMIGASILVFLFSRTGMLYRWEGFILVALIIAFVVYVVREARNADEPDSADYAREYGKRKDEERLPPGKLIVRLLLLVAGLAVMVTGADMLVDGASGLARSLGVSELVIGLTVVAVGTSAPELAASLIAVHRNERDIAVGNAIGSNIFNLLFVLGLTLIVSPNGIIVPPQALRFDIPFMTAVAIVCLPMFYTQFSIGRLEGGLLLTLYGLYTLYLYLGAIDAAILPMYTVMLWVFAGPLLIGGFGFAAWMQWRTSRAAKQHRNAA